MTIARRSTLRPRTSWLALLLLGLVASACDPAGGPSPSPGGSPGGSPGPGDDLTAGELRLLLVDRLGPRWYCDRDEYPVGRDEGQAAIDAWPEVLADRDLFEAVTAALGFDPDGAFDDAEKLAVYRRWKVAASIPFEAVPSGDGYRFDYLARPLGGAADGIRTIGIVDARGAITIEARVAAGEPICPICLAEGSSVDTPSGPVAVERLRVGDPIWTLDAAGRRVAGTVVALGSTEAPAGHRVVRLVLADGRALTASPAHPLADGRALAALEVGDSVDGSAVVSRTWLPYAGGRTYDLLASGATGAYFVDGIPTASTIRPAAVAPAGS